LLTRAAVTAVCSLLLLSAHAAAVEPWVTQLEVELRAGDREALSADLIMPFWQSQRAMAFADLRARSSPGSRRTASLGFGYRKILRERWILGGYAFADYSHTKERNGFHQISAGLELLRWNWGFRGNYYHPDDKPHEIPGTSTAPYAALVDDSVRILSQPSLTENALKGYDAEISVRIPARSFETVIGAGAYWFDAQKESIHGPRLRVESEFRNLPWLGNRARVTLGVEAQTDDARGDQIAAILRLRIPLGGTRESQQATRARELGDLMVSRVERQPWIITETRVPQLISEPAVELITGRSLQTVALVDGRQSLGDALTAAGEGRMIFLNGEHGQIEGDVTLLPGQGLFGAGSSLLVRGEASGTETVFTIPGTRPEIVAEGRRGILLADGTSVVGVVLRGRGEFGQGVFNYGIVGPDGVTNVLIRNNLLIDFGSSGISFGSSASNISIEDNEIVTAGLHGVSFMSNPGGISISGNRIASVGAEAFWFDLGARDVSITRNQVSDTGGWGVFFNNDANNVTIDENTFSRIGNHAVFFDLRAVDVVVSNNEILGAGFHGVYFGPEASRVDLLDNTIDSVDGDAVRFLYDASDVLLARNSISNTGLNPGNDSRDGVVFWTGATNIVLEQNRFAGSIGGDLADLSGGSFSGSGNVDDTTDIGGRFCRTGGLVYTGTGFSFVDGRVCGN